MSIALNVQNIYSKHNTQSTQTYS